jgi:hypothetical protein
MTLAVMAPIVKRLAIDRPLIHALLDFGYHNVRFGGPHCSIVDPGEGPVRTGNAPALNAGEFPLCLIDAQKQTVF